MSSKFKVRRLKRDDNAEDLIPHIVILWEEDDALVPDKERGWEAFARMAPRGLNYKHHDLSFDGGDVSYYFYRNGWVRIHSYEGEAIGVLVESVNTN